MDQEHRITYKAGITRTPSDFLCADGDLAECINLTSDSEELKPVVQPAEHITRYVGIMGNHTPEILYVHKVINQENYIGYLPTNNNKLCFGTVENKAYANLATYDFAWQPGTSKITSIGKTLIISDSNGLHYFLWDVGLYKDLGEMPCPDIDFFLIGSESPGNEQAVTNSLSCIDIIGEGNQVVPGKWDEYNDLVVGLYSKNKKAIAQKKSFCEPFFVRAAVELHDGTFTRFTQPVLLYAAISTNSGLQVNNNNAVMHTLCCQLWYVNRSKMGDWADLIKGIAVFVTDGISIYDTSVDQLQPNFGNYEILDAIFSTAGSHSSQYRKVSYSPRQAGALGRCLKPRLKSDILNDIKSASVFYKLCNLDKEGDGADHNIGDKIGTHVLENITTMDIMQYDDYYSRNKLYPELMFAYNSRLNLANVKRGFFEGFDYFMPRDNTQSYLYTFYVTIRTDSGDIIVMHEKNSTQMQGVYFYYPDSRASHVTIFRYSYSDGQKVCVLNVDLEEHPGLNGAYYFRGLPEENWTEQVVSASDPGYDIAPKETLSNYVITSEVDNPWVFNANGYNKVGTGKIIGLSETTMALSQDAYGRNDLVVFSESGTWGMAVDETGLFQSIHPFTRDVCINPNSITKVDWGVFFVSKKGLMLLTDQGVTCVSERMNGQTFNTASLSPLATGTDWASLVATCQGDTSFLDYIRDSRCFLAYDYIDSRVLVINPGYGYGYIYNMKDATISKTVLPQVMRGVVGNYPDNMLLGGSYVYSFYGKQREEEVTDRQTAFLLTRPMKLAGPVSKASLRQLMNVGMWDKKNGSMVKTEIYLSDDLHKWYEDVSRFGAAAKYYRLALFIKMRPTERLSGTILTEQPRRTDNMK